MYALPVFSLKNILECVCTFSKSLAVIETTDHKIGRKLPESLYGPPLCTGVTLEHFQLWGTTPDFTLLKTIVAVTPQGYRF